MADKPLTVEIVSPERVLYQGEAVQVVTKTLGGGEVAFLADHAPFLAALTENHTRIYLDGGEVLDVAVHGGFVEVSGNKVSILTDLAELGGEIDLARAHHAKERAEEQLRHEHDAVAVGALSRAHARIAAAGGLSVGR